MVTTRNSRADVVTAAGRLFAERGYHGTSMRDLGRELGLLGSSLYAHVESKQDLLVDVVEEGSRLFQESAQRALLAEGAASDRLRAREFRPDADPKITSIMILSILNAIERWYRPDGPLDREALVAAIVSSTLSGVAGA
jgi:AcrR family transcriptional regulator